MTLTRPLAVVGINDEETDEEELEAPPGNLPQQGEAGGARPEESVERQGDGGSHYEHEPEEQEILLLHEEASLVQRCCIFLSNVGTTGPEQQWYGHTNVGADYQGKTKSATVRPAKRLKRVQLRTPCSVEVGRMGSLTVPALMSEEPVAATSVVHKHHDDQGNPGETTGNTSFTCLSVQPSKAAS